MRRLAVFALAAFVVSGLGAVGAQQVAKRPLLRKVPANAKLLKSPRFVRTPWVSTAPGVPQDQRLPFVCSLVRPQATAENPSPGVSLLLWYIGSTPVQTDPLRIFIEVQHLKPFVLNAPDAHYLLYPDQGWSVLPGTTQIPENFNLPPEGQPPLQCTAYGWLDKQ